MTNIDDIEIKNFICNQTSTFAFSAIDIETSEVLYTNNAMHEYMVDSKEKKCYKSFYGKESQCEWCGIENEEAKPFNYEYFNEKTNKWYQVQNMPTTLKDGKKILISIAMDISVQKEAQGKFITTHVKLVQQTEALEKAQKELKVLASVDSLTKLYNRRYFLEISKSILELARRNDSETAILMLDIDKFKNINDTYGHKTGDEVLVAFSKKLQFLSRKSDIVCRWGGEEFVILLPNTGRDGVVLKSEKIRQEIEKLSIEREDSEKLKVTVSIGVSLVNNKKDINLEASINRADKALYKAKTSGRNKVCVEL